MQKEKKTQEQENAEGEEKMLLVALQLYKNIWFERLKWWIILPRLSGTCRHIQSTDCWPPLYKCSIYSETMSCSFKVKIPAVAALFFHSSAPRCVTCKMRNKSTHLEVAHPDRWMTSFFPCERLILQKKTGVQAVPSRFIHPHTCFHVSWELDLHQSWKTWWIVFLSFHLADESQMQRRESKVCLHHIKPGIALVLHSTKHAVCTHRSWDIACWSVPSGHFGFSFLEWKQKSLRACCTSCTYLPVPSLSSHSSLFLHTSYCIKQSPGV